MCNEMMGRGLRIVVVSTYKELRERKIPEVISLDTVAKIYSLHHPRVSQSNARDTVTQWLDNDSSRRGKLLRNIRVTYVTEQD
jgi:hypothetical protein